MAGILLFLLLFSTSFLILYAKHSHNCHEKDCAVCACLLQCEKVLYELSCGISLKTNGNAPLYLFTLTLFYLGICLAKDSPVKQKVRMND